MLLVLVVGYAGAQNDTYRDRVMLSLIRNQPSSGVIPKIQSLTAEYGLPQMGVVLTGQWTRGGWKGLTRRMLLAKQFSEFIVDCSHLPLAQCSTIKLGRPLPHLSICKGFLRTTRHSNIRIRLLVNCCGLEAESSRFRNSLSDGSCKLCNTGSTEDAHFLLPRSIISAQPRGLNAWRHRPTTSL